MRRPAFYALVFFTLGVVLGDLFDLPLQLLLSLFILCLLFSLVFLLRKERIAASFFLVLSLLLAGFFRHELATRQFPPDHVSGFLGLDSRVIVTGKIVEEPDVREDKTFITVEAETICVSAKAHSSSGRIILKVREPAYGFDFADRIRFKGYLNEPSSGRNPGAFDYKRYLDRKRVFGTVTLVRADEVEILGGEAGNSYRSRLIIPLRRWIQNVFGRTVSGDHKALLAGFLLGETRDISKKVYNMFRDTGTVHLLAVSGSNVWLVVGVILAALGLFRVPKIPATLLSLICILIFANLVRNDPPVVRAGIMAAVVLLGSLLYRDMDLINVVSFAGLMILFVSPLFLFDVGFQLSFASVFGILLVYPKLKALFPRSPVGSRKKLWKWVFVPALISLSVELLLFPILAYYFNMVPLVVVVANIFIVPLASLAVVLACFTLFSAIFSISLAGIFSGTNWLCLELTLRLTELFASFPAAKIPVAAPSTSTFLLYYLFLWALLCSIGSRKKVYLFSALIIANLFIWRYALSPGGDDLKVAFLDAGKGSATVIEVPGGGTLLINAGEKTGPFDAGEYVVIPFLNHQGIAKLDGLILTGTDQPSICSASSVAGNREVETLYLAADSASADRCWGVLTDHTENRVFFLDSTQAIAGEKSDFSVRFFIYPTGGGLDRTLKQTLIKVAYKGVCICLLDGMKKVRFASRFDWSQFQNCSILVLSELGDENEIAKIISATAPQKIVFTRHYHRHDEHKIPLLMQRAFPGLEYCRTAEGGAITCRTQGKEVEIRPTLRPD